MKKVEEEEKKSKRGDCQHPEEKTIKTHKGLTIKHERFWLGQNKTVCNFKLRHISIHRLCLIFFTKQQTDTHLCYKATNRHTFMLQVSTHAVYHDMGGTG